MCGGLSPGPIQPSLGSRLYPRCSFHRPPFVGKAFRNRFVG